jgi:hypothetical protein
MSHQKIKESYCSCKLVAKLDICMHHKYDSSQPCLTLLASCILCMWQQHYNYGKCKTPLMITLQLVYGLNIYDHVTCMHCHHQLNLVVETNLQLVINYDS